MTDKAVVDKAAEKQKEIAAIFEPEAPVAEPEGDSTQEESTPKSNPHEERARTSGWVSKKEWEESGRDPEDWKDARTFNREGEMMERITELKGGLNKRDAELQKLRDSVTKLAKFSAKQLEAERAKTKRELKAAKVVALRNEDHEAVVEIDEQLDLVKEQEAEAKAEVEAEEAPASKAQPQQDPVITAWLADAANAWYKSDEDAKAIADTQFLKQLDKGKSITEALKHATEYVKTRFPQHFEAPKAKPKSKVAEGGDNVPSGKPNKGTKGKYSVADLDDATKQYGKEMISLGAFKDMQEYVDALAADKYFG